MNKIKSVTIVGGTHGNELSSIHLLHKWEKNPELIERRHFATNTFFANPKAYAKKVRYVDCDLNRQFKLDDLNNFALVNYEQSRAKVINNQLGQKENAKTDFIVDLHNTTSNMGACLMLLGSNVFNKRMGGYVKSQMPNAVILFQDYAKEYPFLISMAKHGVTVEVGPQHQAVLRHDILNLMEEMTGHILDYVELANKDALPELPNSYEAFDYVETLKIPVDESGNRIGLVHEKIEGRDFCPLNPDEPVISLFDGDNIYWDGDYEAYPFFINEAAYYEENIAMSISKKIIVDI